MRRLGWLILLLVACKSHHGAGAGDAMPDAKAVLGDGGEVAAREAAPAALPATPPDDALPPPASEELTARAKHLLEAIQKDDGDSAADLVFPRDAYLAVKDIPDPGKNWDSKVLAAFRAGVHAYHRQKKGIERAVFTGFDVGAQVAKATAKKDHLKKPLWRSKRAKLAFTIDGKPSSFVIGELMGWEGSWYVTRLRGRD